MLRGEHALTTLLDRLRETFGQDSVTLLEHTPGIPLTAARQRDPAGWQIVTTVGGEPCHAPDEGDTGIPTGEDLGAPPCYRQSATTCAPRSARPWRPSRAWPTLISPGPATSAPNW